MSFTPEVTMLIGVLTSVLVAALNEAMKRGRGINLQRGWLTVLLFVVSIPLALMISPASMPGIPVFSGNAGADFMLMLNWFASVVAVLSQVAGAAMAIYNILLKRIIDSMDLPTIETL